MTFTTNEVVENISVVLGNISKILEQINQKKSINKENEEVSVAMSSDNTHTKYAKGYDKCVQH
jgi:hypothetical protein